MTSPSTTPVFSHFPIRRSNPPSLTRCFKLRESACRHGSTRLRLALNRFAVLVRLLSDEELAVLSSSRATPFCTCPALSLRWCRDVCHSTSGLMPSSSSKLSAFPVTITGYPCFPYGPQRFAFRRSVTRPTHSLHLASYTPCWIGTQVHYWQGGYARLVGIGRLPACTHWVRWFDRKKLPTRNRSFVRIPDLFHHEGHEGHEEHQEIR